MPQEAATPIAPQAPSPRPGAPSVTVLTPGAPLPLEGVPRTAAEVEGLHARREILRDQLSRANTRRDNLASQLNRDIADEARPGLQQRLAVLDERIVQIEQDQALTERLLSSTPPEVLASTSVPSFERGMMDEDDAAGLAFATFGLGVVLTLLVSRFWRRRVGGGARAAGAKALPADPRHEQLMQQVEAIALEVERIGEGQRFVTELLIGPPESVPVRAEGDRG